MKSTERRTSVRNLVVVLGDQLDREGAAFDGFDRDRDAVWMAEVREETEHVWAHKLRIATFFAAMRHFRDELRARGIRVEYTAMPADPAQDEAASFADLLLAHLRHLRPERVVLTQPGDHRVLTSFETVARAHGVPLDVREDRHFLVTRAEFEHELKGKRRPVLETFYRFMRKRTGLLMDGHGGPAGNRWNYDTENRESFGRNGPRDVPSPPRFANDRVTKDVIDLVNRRFSTHPGGLETVHLPVTSEQAQKWLNDFVVRRLPLFGKYEDAVWDREPVLYHSQLSFPLNVKLLSARDCLTAAVEAFETGHAPLASVEAFVRQILGWREFVRGLYWREMPDYIELNALGCDNRPVPAFYWNGETDMACVRSAMHSVLKLGYTHHIQRLMILGLFCLLLGVHPRRFHEWHMALYIDAVDWASLPNTLGMSQYGDGGIVGTKPYIASANYINKMTNHCAGCRYDPRKRIGEDACPFNALYGDFLARHRPLLEGNPRTQMQVRNLDRRKQTEIVELRRRADVLRSRIDAGTTI